MGKATGGHSSRGAADPPRRHGSRPANGDAGDAGLVTALGRGEVNALATAYARYGALVHSLADLLCGPGAAEEVTQAVFLALWDSPGTFGPGRGSLRRLLVAETHRRAVDLLRARPTHLVRKAARQADDEVRELLAGAPGQAIARLLRGLSTTERKAITLAWSGYTRGQVAALLHLPPGVVNAAIGTGMARLRPSPLPQASASPCAPHRRLGRFRRNRHGLVSSPRPAVPRSAPARPGAQAPRQWPPDPNR